MADLSGELGDVYEWSPTREPDQKVPVFEEIELRIEAAQVQKGISRDEERGQRNVVVDQQQIGIVILREEPQSRVRFGLPGPEENRDSVGVRGHFGFGRG